NVKLGDRVRFGYSAIAVISSKEGEVTQIISPELREITLSCLEVMAPKTECTTMATIVQVSYQPNGTPDQGKYVEVDGHVYAARGTLAEELLKFPVGSQFPVGYFLDQDCYLPTVVTYPNIEGCIGITCLKTNTTQGQ
ncbi:MAG: hypothetical protein LPK45_04495, partial [Bacteroidota bacterium]|nr:hypothetical protein [Bacteroidota bacterium]MDX5430314.1 hypothetical protein [Bacteroidota bacterium]MDX5469075.1 hypothetical protein [Bacteroidota bacterium]